MARKLGKHSKLSALEKREFVRQANLIEDINERIAWVRNENPEDFGHPLPDPLKKLLKWSHCSMEGRSSCYGEAIEKQLADKLRELVAHEQPLNIDIMRAMLSTLLEAENKVDLLIKHKFGSSWAIAFAKRNSLPTKIYSMIDSVFSTVGNRSLKRKR
jgi:hypothetical protein